MLDLKSVWLKHLGIDSNFPRDLGFPERVKIQNWWQYIRTIELNWHTNNIYVALYSDYYIKNNIWDKLFFDIDAHVNLNTGTKRENEGGLGQAYHPLKGAARRSLTPLFEDAYADALRLYDYLHNEFNATPRVYFTGGGFAVYLDFEPLVVDKYSIRMFCHRIVAKAKVKHIDTHPFGDSRRISRIPYTWNFKYNPPRMCIPIDVDWTLEKIIEEALHPCYSVGIEIEPVKVTIPEYEPPEFDRQDASYVEDDLILYIFENAHRWQDGRKRLLHFILVPTFMHKYGLNRKEIHRMCRLFIERTGADYSEYESYVESSITRTERDGWKPWSIEYFLYKCPELLEYYRR